jgi:hypothetical protein
VPLNYQCSKENKVCIFCEGKSIRELQEASHILVETTACGAPCLQRVKVNSEKLRILLLLWFLLRGGGALGTAK